MIKKLKVNKKNISKALVGLGIGCSLLLTAKNTGLHMNGFKPDFYYLNTKNIELSNEELTDIFKDKFETSSVLADEFSEIYPTVSEFIGEYGEYLDQEQLIDTISDLDVRAVDNDKYGENLLAYYNPLDNTIYLKDKINSKKDEQIKEIKEHEFFHYLFFQGFSYHFSNFFHTGKAIDEGMATLLTQESGDFRDTVAYKKNANYVRVICELIGSDNFMRACGNHDLGELIDYLAEYSDRTTAKKLIKNIDKACRDYGYVPTDADKDAWDIINSMYTNKNSCSIEESDDYVMKYYSNKIIRTCYKIDGVNSIADINVNKNYFLNIDVPKIEFIKDGNVYGEIILDNIDRNNKTFSK